MPRDVDTAAGCCCLPIVVGATLRLHLLTHKNVLISDTSVVVQKVACTPLPVGFDHKWVVPCMYM